MANVMFFHNNSLIAATSVHNHTAYSPIGLDAYRTRLACSEFCNCALRHIYIQSPLVHNSLVRLPIHTFAATDASVVEKLAVPSPP